MVHRSSVSHRMMDPESGYNQRQCIISTPVAEAGPVRSTSQSTPARSGPCIPSSPASVLIDPTRKDFLDPLSQVARGTNHLSREVSPKVLWTFRTCVIQKMIGLDVHSPEEGGDIHGQEEPEAASHETRVSLNVLGPGVDEVQGMHLMTALMIAWRVE